MAFDHCNDLQIQVINNYCGYTGTAEASTIFIDMKPAQCRAARALIGMTQTELAEAAGFGLSTIVDFEKERRIVSDTAISGMTEALEKSGVQFIPENGGGAGVRLQK